MPYSSTWVPPAVFLTRKGVKVYCTYKNDDLQEGPREYNYSLDDLCGEESCECNPHLGGCKFTFDVRELVTWKEPEHPPFKDSVNDRKEILKEKDKAWDVHTKKGVEAKAIRKAIIDAIDRRLLTKEGRRAGAYKEVASL